MNEIKQISKGNGRQAYQQCSLHLPKVFLQGESRRCTICFPCLSCHYYPSLAAQTAWCCNIWCLQPYSSLRESSTGSLAEVVEIWVERFRGANISIKTQLWSERTIRGSSPFCLPIFVQLSTDSEATRSCLLNIGLSFLNMKYQHCLFFMKPPNIKSFVWSSYYLWRI